MTHATSTTEAPAPLDLDALSTVDIVATFARLDATISDAIEPELPAIVAAVDAVAARMAAGGRLVFVGAGTSGRLGLLQVAEIGPTFGLEEGIVVAILAGVPEQLDPDNLLATDDAAEDDAGAGATAIAARRITAADAIVGIAASGRTPFTRGALAAARARGALTIALACDHPTPLAEIAELTIHPVVGPEIVAGSTRLRAGTATKMVLDILATGAMVKLDRVVRGRMIDVRPTNAKLRDRAIRIVAELTGHPTDEARNALESVGWSARTAVILLELELDPDRALARAAAHRSLGEALAAPADGEHPPGAGGPADQGHDPGGRR